MLMILMVLLLGDMALTSPPSPPEESISIQTIALYYSPKCPHSIKVLSYLQKEHLSIPLKNVIEDTQAKSDLKKIGGFSIVPCLIVDQTPIYEDDRIIQWLSEHQKILRLKHF